jgi:hypothetical protein
MAGFNASDFYNNPAQNTLAAFIDPLGVLFFGILMFLIMGWVLIKTENWVSATAVGILMTILFSAALPAMVLYLVGIAAVFVFASVIIDVVILS